jgi:ABC-type lipoprotein export system ATPase subunit/bifunctional DNA-binding transcriptional regulator/antitoxin component of YhaV-PrlF toxin-antitoxin module
MTDNPFIVCDNLVRIYKILELEVVALQGLDLTVAPGEMLGIIGASGSGKSTLLNILGGLDRPSAGGVTVGGQNLLKLSDRALDRYRRTQVGFVWQQTGRNLIPYLSARENVELPMTISGAGFLEKRARSRELLEAVGLWEHRKHRLSQLSGGQQQRIGIAVALANRPSLLLADEPTGEVDSATAQDVLALLHDLNQGYGLTTIIVTHDMQIARRVDRVVAIRDGRTSSDMGRGRGEGVEIARGEQKDAPTAEDTYSEHVVLDSAGRLQIPKDYLEETGIGDRATVEVTAEGILVRPVAGRERRAVAPLLNGLEEEPPTPRQRGLRKLWGRVRKRSVSDQPESG